MTKHKSLASLLFALFIVALPLLEARAEPFVIDFGNDGEIPFPFYPGATFSLFDARVDRIECERANCIAEGPYSLGLFASDTAFEGLPEGIVLIVEITGAEFNFTPQQINSLADFTIYSSFGFEGTEINTITGEIDSFGSGSTGLAAHTFRYGDGYYTLVESAYGVDPPPAPTPEPTTMVLIGTGLAGFIARRCLRAKKSA